MATNTGSIGAFYVGLTPVTKLYVGDYEAWSGSPAFVPAAGTPTYVASSTLAYFTAPAGPVSYTLPVCDVGDLQVLSLCTMNTTAQQPTVPAGWTVAHTSDTTNSFGYSVFSRTYYRFKQSGDSAVVTMINGQFNTAYSYVHAHAFRNVSTFTPFESSSGITRDVVNPMSVTAQNITTTKTKGLVIHLLTAFNQSSPTLSAPSIGVQRDNQFADNRVSGLTTVDAVAAGVYSGPTWTISPNSAATNAYFEVVSLALIVAPTQVMASAIAALNPVAWLKLDDASGALVNYGSGSDNGTAVGALTYRANAGPDGASYMRFANGQYVSLPGITPGNASRNLATSKTLAIAFRPTSAAGYSLLMSKGLTGGDREWLVYDSDASGRWMAYIGQDVGSSAVYRETALSPNYNTTLNTWHFMVIVLDKGNPIRVYVDSPIERPATRTGPTGTQETGGTDIVTIGAWPGLETMFYFDGALAHATIFEGAMSNSDVATLMASATAEGWTPPPPPPPVFAPAIAATSPASWFKLSEQTMTPTNFGSNGGSAGFSGASSWNVVSGPDGNTYWDMTTSAWPLNAANPPTYSIGSTGITYMMSFRPTMWEASGYTMVFSKGADPDVYFYINSVMNRIEVYTMDTAGQYHRTKMYHNITFKLNTWNTLIYTRDTSGADVVYPNSATALPMTSTTGASASPLKLTSTASQHFGRNNNTGGGIIGGMAHCATWNRVLSGAEVTALMSAAQTEGWRPPVGPVFKGSTVIAHTSSTFQVVPIPAGGAVAGDLAVVGYSANYSFGSAVSMVGGRVVHQNGPVIMYSKMLTSQDISNGYVQINTFNAPDPRGNVCIAVFSGLSSTFESAFTSGGAVYGAPVTMPVPVVGSSLNVIVVGQYSNTGTRVTMPSGNFTLASEGATTGANSSGTSIFYSINKTGLALPNQTFAGTSLYNEVTYIAAEFGSYT